MKGLLYYSDNQSGLGTCAHETLGNLAKMQILISVGLGWGLGLCISNKLPVEANSFVPWITL